jgi:hypothetical protein
MAGLGYPDEFSTIPSPSHYILTPKARNTAFSIINFTLSDMKDDPHSRQRRNNPHLNQ